MSWPAVSTLEPSGLFTPEELLDVLAYILATSPQTSGVQWIVGDIGMGEPGQSDVTGYTLPFGYIGLFNETVLWQTANGGRGGLSAGGVNGLDDWQSMVLLTVASAKHQYQPPIPANPPSGSPVNPASLGGLQPPFNEQPGWRLALQLNEGIKAVLRSNIVVGGEAASTRVTEVRPVFIAVAGSAYRAYRLTVQAQQRRRRGV